MVVCPWPFPLYCRLCCDAVVVVRGVAGAVVVVASCVLQSALRFFLALEGWADGCGLSAESAGISFFDEEWDSAVWIDGSRALSLKRFSSS